ncbi:MAG: adenylyl-sulfate kinase, partial [Phycisphaerae bacterium]|nr:adenylyl-sulfate kinase [Phycisphaerae bacterium]
QSTGFTLDQQVYIKAGELMCKTDEQPARVASHLKANIFWMARQPMIKGKRYKIKLAGARVPVWLRQIINVLDASDLTTDLNRQQIERHDVAECILETLKPVAFDTSQDMAQTGRFVIIDNYEIAGGGIILDSAQNVTNRITERVEQREKRWERSSITPEVRTGRYNQRSTLVLICGSAQVDKENLAKALEENLFNDGRFVYYLGLSNSLLGIDAGMDISESGERDEYIRQLGEISHLFTDAGMILITTVSDIDDYELETINTLNKPNDCRVINIGPNLFSRTNVDLQIDSLNDVTDAVNRIKQLLTTKKYLIEYYL